MKRAAMQPILFILAKVVVTVLMTTPPIAAEPLLTPRPLPIADVGEEALEIAETAIQMVDWLFDGDDGNDTDTSGNDADTSSNDADTLESSAQIE